MSAKLVFAITLVLCLTFSAAGLQASVEKETDEDTADMGNITVEDESETITLTHSAMPVSVIEMEQFHGRNISLNEVLKRVAGIKIRQEGGLGSKANIAIQGLEGKRVKLFIDGSPLNTPDGTFGLNDLPIQLIERVEIYKGVVPARFGGDALGGAVNVVTREFEGNYVDVTASAGSYDTYRGTLVLKKNFDKQKIEWGIGGFFNSAANDYVMDSPYVDGLTIKRDHDQYTSWILGTAGKIKERWFDEIEIELVHYESDKEIQGVKTPIKEAKSQSRLNVAVLSFEKEHFFSDNLAFEYDFAFVDMTLNLIDKADTCYNWDGTPRACSGVGGEINGIPHDSADKQTDLRNDLNLNYRLHPDYAVNFHLNAQYTDYQPNDDLAGESLGYDVGAFPSDKTNTVASLGLESSHFSSAVVNDMGVKYYHYDYNITSQERGLTATPVQSHNSGGEFGYYESIRYEPLQDLFIKASYEHAYRLPNSEEIFGDGITITSAPDLVPEKADNFNIGLLFDRRDLWRLPWFKAELNVFYRHINDMIKLGYGTHTAGYVNLGEVDVKGFEIDLQTDITDHWYVYLNYTNQSLTDQQKKLAGTRSTPNPTYGLDLPNVPKQYGNIGLEYKLLGLFRNDSLFKVFWETNWCDQYYYGWELSRNQDRKINAQFSHAAGLEYSFMDDRWIIGFEVRNLTDEKITDVFNCPLAGRSFYLNLRYSWFTI